MGELPRATTFVCLKNTNLLPAPGRMLEGGQIDSIEASFSSYGKISEDDNTENDNVLENESIGVDYNEPFLLVMVDDPPIGTRFYITTFAAPHMEGINVCFGKVLAGRSVIRKVEKLSGTHPEAVIVDCGEYSQDSPLPRKGDGTGDDYEDEIYDDVRVNMEIPSTVFKAVKSIKDIGTGLFKLGDMATAHKKYGKAIRYLKEYFPDDLNDDDLEQLVSLKFSVYLNASLTAYKLENGPDAVRYATEALDLETGTNLQRAKAHYRLGLGYLLCNDEEKALVEFDEALTLLPGDAAIIKSRGDAIRKKQERRAKEKAGLSRMLFSK